MDDRYALILARHDVLTSTRFRAVAAIIEGLGIPDLEFGVWAGLPSFFAGARCVRVIPFKDHLNVESENVVAHAEDFVGCRMTPKGMLQIDHDAPLPADALNRLFAESLGVKR